MKNILLLTTLFLLASCKIFRLPGRVKVDKEISGICTSKKDPCIQKNMFIIMHGIGSQKSDYSAKIISRLNDYTFGKNNYKCKTSVLHGSQFIEMGDGSLKKIYEEYKNNGEIEVIKITATALDNSQSGKENTFYSINWSVVLNESKHNLEETEFGYSPRYWGINKFIKRIVMVRRMSDAFAGSQPELAQKFYNTYYEIVTDGNILKNDNSTLNVITGSFGTQLFLGAINELQKKKESTYYTNLSESNKSLFKDDTSLFFDNFQSKVIIDNSLKLHLYALTNQVNLMPNNVNQWFSGLDKDSSKLNFSSVQIMAFRNPNDILCYYLPDSAGKNFFPSTIHESVTVINSYYFNWPFKNDVASAHTAVFNLKKLSKIIYYGSNSNWIRKKKTLYKKGICFTSPNKK